MKRIGVIAMCLLGGMSLKEQEVDIYGLQTFKELIKNKVDQSWTPSAVSEYKEMMHFIMIDFATQSKVVSFGTGASPAVNVIPKDSVTSGAFVHILNSVFQVVSKDGNSIFKPIMGSYYALD